MGSGAHLRLGATPAASAPDPEADAQTQRHCGLGQDAENRVGALQTTSALTSEQPSSEPGSVHSPFVVRPQQLHERCGMLGR